MNKINSKNRALKKTVKKTGFFRALIFGFIICAVVWCVLALIFSFVMSRHNDANLLLKILSPVAVIISLVSGGFAAGKIDKTCATLSSLALGSIITGLSYALSVLLDMPGKSDNLSRLVYMALVLVSPLVGARFSVRKKRNKRPGNGRM